MPSPAPLALHLVGVVEIDPLTFQLTVLERWSERRWFRSVEHEQQRTYTLQARVGTWLDGDEYVPRSDPRHGRLWELFGAWRIERKLDAFIEIDEPLKYQLPPVPVLPRR